MKNKYNNLLKYIYDYSEKIQHKETVNSLFRSILEPLIQNQKVDACILLKIQKDDNKNLILKRLSFSNAVLYDFNECSVDNLWNNTEFLVVLSERYSAALLWDYSDCEIKNHSKVCILYNSKIISEIAKIIADNSKEDLSGLIKKYVPDRRENRLLNSSVQKLVNFLNDKNEDLILDNAVNSSNIAEIVESKAKFIAHEIKNYISIINLYSTIANKRFSALEEKNETVNSIENALKNIAISSENISYLISDLRCMSKPFKTEIRLKPFIENTLELCKLKAEQFNANICLKNVEDIIVTSDKTKIQCAVLNIIFNALDANAKNITIETKNNSIFIKNDGEKIPDEIKDKIFKKDFTTKENGNGLGLSFCKSEMQQIGGDIILISSTDIETVFEIKIK